MRPSVVTIGFGLALVTMGTTARAADSFAPSAEDGSAHRTHVWYGWQTLLADAASVTLAFAPLVISPPNVNAANTTLPIGALGYLAIPPAIHFAHGEGVRGVLSLGLRGALPALGYFAGGGINSCDRNSGKCGPNLAGPLLLLVGAGVAAIIDDAALAWTSGSDAPSPAPAPSPPRAAGVTWAPLAGVGVDARGGAAPTVGMFGAF